MASSVKVHLVTGAASEDHVSSANAGSMNAGMVGPGSYVLLVGEKLAARIESANAVVVDTGTAVHNGRQIDVETPATLTIDSGTQGQKRNDLIVLRYTKSGEYESATLEVIKGTPTASTPSDPSYNKGSILDGATISDMPLYRIPISGITPGTPVQLFVGPIPVLGDMVREKIVLKLESGCTSATAEAPFYIRKSGMISLKGRVKVSQENGAICDLSDIIDSMEYSSQTNRSSAAVGITSAGSESTVVWIDGNGILRATAIESYEGHDFVAIDVSGLMFLAK